MSTATRSWREKLDYLVEKTGRSDLELVSRAMEEGVEVLYRRSVGDAYLRGEISRERAVEELGSDEVEELEFSRDAIRSDIRWGLKRA
jgi:hypothetical protein